MTESHGIYIGRFNQELAAGVPPPAADDTHIRNQIWIPYLLTAWAFLERGWSRI